MAALRKAINKKFKRFVEHKDSIVEEEGEYLEQISEKQNDSNDSKSESSVEDVIEKAEIKL